MDILILISKIWMVSFALNLLMLPRIYQKTDQFNDMMDHISLIIFCAIGNILLNLVLFFIYGSMFIFIVIMRWYPNEDAFWEEVKTAMNADK